MVANMFDAYTIKKVVPRLVAAIILIQLSWFIFTNMLRITNDIAFGLEGLMYAPFGGKDALSLSSLISTLAGDGGGKTLFTTMVVAGGATVGVAMTSLGVLSLAFSALLAAMIALFVLALRRVILIALIIVAPIALVAWILPGTEKYWKIWWESFSKLLMMFPLIVLIVSAGRVLAFVTMGTPGGNGVIASTTQGISEWILVIVCYFGPYFIIPKTFAMAGTALSSLAGMANDRSRGVFDRLKKGRQARTADSFARMKTGDRYQGRNSATRMFNRRSEGIGGGWRAAHFGFGERGTAYRDNHGREAGEEAIKNNPALRQLAYDDNANAVLALSGGSAAGAERAAHILAQAHGWDDDTTRRALATASSVGFNKSNTIGAQTTLAQNKSRALTGALAGQAGMDLVRQSAVEVSGGNQQLTDNLMGGFAYHSRNAGRLDLGGETEGQDMLDGWQRSSVAQHAQSFGASMQTFADAASGGIAAGNPQQRRASSIALMEMQSMLPNATGENQSIINQALADAGVNHELNVSVEDQLANLASGFSAEGLPLDANGHPMAGPIDESQRVISGADIRGLARVYDQQTPIASRGGAPPVQPPPAGP